MRLLTSGPASVSAYEYLVHHGYTHVRRYAGAILDWEEAGYPLKGEMVEQSVTPWQPELYS